MLAELLNSPQGQGLLAAAFGAAASARRGAPFNTIGAGGLAGLSAFANAQDRITQQKQDQVRQQYMQGQLEHLNAQTAEQQRKAKTAEEQRAWLQTQNPATLATGGSMAPTTDNAQRLSQVDPRQQQMWDLAARGLLPFDKYLEMTAPQKPQHKVVGNTLLEVGGQGVKPLYTAPDAGKMSPLGQLYAEMEKLPAGSPQRAAYQAAITKATTHQPGVSVSYGAPVPALDMQGRPVFFQPGKDGGSPKIVPGVQPPKIGDDIRAADEARSKDLQTVDASIAVLDKALNHPGRATATGMSGVLDPRNVIPGTDARDYRAIADQIQGKAFLQAFESLKGGGQITEVEGKKATDAIARLDRAQSDAEYETALRELRGVMAGARRRIDSGMRRTGGASGDYKNEAEQPAASSLQDAARAEIARRRGGR